MGSDSTTFIEIGGEGLGDFDRFDVAGDATIDGGLQVSLINGFVLQNGMEFVVADVDGARTGFFDNYQEGEVVLSSGGIDLLISYQGGSGNDITFQAIPEPGVLGLFVSAMVIGGFRRRRR